jgi:hypothetical protein
MPREQGGGPAATKPEMIAAVIGGDVDRPAAEVRAEVWERYEQEVTTQEIARVRKKLRQDQAGAADGSAASRPAAVAEPPPERPKKSKPAKARAKEPAPERKSADAGKPRAKGAPRKRPAGIRAKDFAGAAVTVQQLSAILEVADETGGLGRLREALGVVALLRERVGGADERQLAYALEFLERLTAGRAGG